VDGAPVSINTPQDALDQGLRFISRQLEPGQEPDIARNMFWEWNRCGGTGVVNERLAPTRGRPRPQEIPHDLRSPSQFQISVTEQKMVEIARALTTKAKVIVQEEPTDVLEDRSRKDLFQVIRQLKQEQGGCLRIHLASVRRGTEIGDRVTILRDGANVGTYESRTWRSTR